MAQAIIDKIILDAEQKASEILSEAEIKANNILKQSESYANNQRDESIKKQKAESKLLIERRKTVANLDVKKLFLRKKQEIISVCFEKAINKVKTSKNYLAIIEKMLSFAEDGDIVYISVNDKEVITPSFIDNYKKKEKKDIELGKEYKDILGGIIISSKGFDKNLSLEVEINSLKEEVLTDVAEILFN